MDHRTRTATAAAASVAAAVFACASPPIVAAATIDLDVPDVRAELAVAHPPTSATIDAILADAARLPPAEAARTIRALHAADDVDVGALLLASYPAKRRVSFVLDGTGYRATVTVENASALRRLDRTDDGRRDVATPDAVRATASSLRPSSP